MAREWDKHEVGTRELNPSQDLVIEDNADSDSEEDPLDAFMAGIETQVRNLNSKLEHVSKLPLD